MPFQNSKKYLFAFTQGLLLTVLIYADYFQRNFFSKTYAAYSIGIFILSSLFFYLINQFFLFPLRQSFKPSIFRIICLAAVLISCLLALNFNLPPLYVLLPEHTIQINIPVQNHSENDFIHLESVENALGTIHYSIFNLTGDWTKTDEAIQINPNVDFSLAWQGKFGHFIEVIFQPTAFPTAAEIILNGENTHLELQNSNDQYGRVFHQDFPIPTFSTIPVYFSFASSASSMILLIWSLLTRLPKNQPDKSIGNKGWYLYALPPVIIWFFSLLVFWPGMMSSDSIDQWRQALTGQMTNWHPIFHTFLISLLIKIWQSPAIVAGAQILSLSTVFACGMGILQKHGISKKILWTISLLFAYFPSNAILSITLWKDVAYGTALLAFYLFILQIAVTSGSWLNKNWHWLVLGMSAFLTAILRPNGTAVALGTLLILLLIFKEQRRRILWSLAIAFLAWLGVNGLLNWRYNLFSTDQPSQANLTLLSHISAHVENGTTFKPDETQYLNSLLPLTNWNYDCCYIGNISYNPDFNRQEYLQNLPQNLKLTISLFLRNPMVDIQHQLCASETIWRFTGNQCSFKSLHAFNAYSPGNESWIEPNTYGLKEGSLLPKLIPVYMRYLASMGFFTGQSTLLLKPAFYFYLSLVLTCAAAINRRDATMLALLTPVLLQSIVLALIIFAPSFRYQYGICLIGLISLGLPFLPNKTQA